MERSKQALQRTGCGRPLIADVSRTKAADFLTVPDNHKLDAPLILGDPAASHLPPLVEVPEHLGPHEYRFMSNDQFDVVLREDWCEAQRIYWLETLYRAHWAAATSLGRTARWVSSEQSRDPSR